MTYWYCSIRVKNVRGTYSYISDLGELSVGSYVEVPFGSGNAPRIGIVESCAEYEENNTPFPLDRTKHIARLASAEEYEEDAEDHVRCPDEYCDDMEDIVEVGYYIRNEDWECVMEWAETHFDSDCEETLRKVAECCRLCMEQNMPIAALDLGTLYYTGRGVQQDYSEAFRLYKIAADAGELRAICNLGYCHYYGRNCAVDYEKAYHYFQLGALLFNDANCLYKLGDMYANGFYVTKNEQYAYKLYVRALEALEDSDHDCLADVHLRLGKCRLCGIGIAQNVEQANSHLHIALIAFYKRRKTDPFVSGLIRSTKQLIQEAEALLDAELLR